MKLVVPDASVVIKWSLPDGAEEYQDTAGKLLDALAYERIWVNAPALWYFELGNTLARRHPDQADVSLQQLQAMLHGCVAGVSAEWRNRTIDLIRRYGVTLYDASYHALAIVNEGTFLTADEKYLQAVAADPRIIHLKRWH